MKRLYLLRHAKSDWQGDSPTDHDRPLSARGRRAASTVGRFLAAVGQRPDAVVTSTAVRARATVEIAASAGGWSCPVTATERLYAGSPDRLLEVVRETDDAVGRVLLAGHEPVWSESAGRRIGGGRIKLVTAAVVRIDLESARWRDAAFGAGTLAWLVTPKLLTRFGG